MIVGDEDKIGERDLQIIAKVDCWHDDEEGSAKIWNKKSRKTAGKSKFIGKGYQTKLKTIEGREQEDKDRPLMKNKENTYAFDFEIVKAIQRNKT